MISWIQRTFQQHFKAVFFVLLAVTIISFIITIGATPGIGRADRRAIQSDFFGHNLGSQADLQQMLEDAQISAELQLGYAGLGEDQLRNYALERAAALHLADAMRVPAATPEQLTAYIQGLRLFAGRDGRFDPEHYASFRDSLQRGLGPPEGEVSRVMLDDVRIGEVQRLLDGPGYVLPFDVREEMSQANTRWTLGVATVDYASYRPPIQPGEAQLARFYAENAFRYKVQPRVVAGYVDFPASDYLRSVSLTEADVRAYYDAHAASYAPKAPAAGAPKIAVSTPDARYEAARARAEADLRLERAGNLAAQAAADLTVAIYEGKVAQGPALAEFLASRHLSEKALAPFTHAAGPAEFGGSSQIADAAFQLTADRYYSDALQVPSGAIVLLRKETLPAYQPPLAAVRAKVVADDVESIRREDFIALGRTLREELGRKLRAGEPLARAAAELAAQTSVKIAVKQLGPFTLLQPPADLTEPVQGALQGLAKGQVSNMVATADTGYLVYAQDKQAPDMDPLKNPQVEQTRIALAAVVSRFASSDTLSQLVAEGLKRANPPPQ